MNCSKQDVLFEIDLNFKYLLDSYYIADTYKYLLTLKFKHFIHSQVKKFKKRHNKIYIDLM